VPVLLGVVLFGFAVGAVLSMISASREGALVARMEPSPQLQATPSRIAAANRVSARPKLTPYPAVVPTIAHTPTPEVPQASLAPSSEATDSPVPPTATPTLVGTFVPATPSPAPLPTVTATESASVPPTDADSEFAQEAAQAVNGYLTALREGDEDAASAMLAPGLSLSEEAFMDRTARITRIHATGTSTDAAVQARVVAAQGAYEATFSVERGPKGPIIRAHEFAKEK
jgi:hypothetical protein